MKDKFNPAINEDAVYLSLIKGFKELGYFDDADQCFYHYRYIKDNNRLSRYIHKKYNNVLAGVNLDKLIDPIACISCGYGTSPGYTLLSSGLIIILFGLAYWLNFIFFAGNGLMNLANAPINITVIPLTERSFQIIQVSGNQIVVSPLNIFINLINYRYIYLSTMIFVSQIPSNWYIYGFWKYAVILERILGGLSFALFIVVLAKKLIRY